MHKVLLDYLLAANDGQLLTRDEIRDAGAGLDFIKTEAGRGYRFIATSSDAVKGS